MIEVRDLRLSYGRTPALQGFSLQVEPGELVGLVGPNGAGKTTLIKVLATLLKPKAGKARLDGVGVEDDPKAVRRTIGYLPDVAGLYMDMTAREFLEFFADAFHLPAQKKQDAVRRALRRAHLEDRAGDFVEQLSFGMKQRLLLAKTLLHEPKILLLDEPATGLDPLARIELREDLKTLHETGVTILVSSHILSDLEEICTRVVFIAGGKNLEGEAAETQPGRPGPAEELVCVLECREGAARVKPLFESNANISLVEERGARLRLRILGGEQTASELLAQVVAQGLCVTHYSVGRAHLEDTYRERFGGRSS